MDTLPSEGVYKYLYTHTCTPMEEKEVPGAKYISQKPDRKEMIIIELTNLLRHLGDHVNRTLSHMSVCELDGDTKKGISEMTLKFIIVSYFVERASLYDIYTNTTPNEKVDLHIRHRDTQAILLLRIKYTRIGFLEATRAARTTPIKEKLSLWEKENERILQMTPSELEHVQFRYNNNNMNPHQQKSPCLMTVEKSLSLAVSYNHVRALEILRSFSLDVNHQQEQDTIYHSVLFGIGQRFVTTTLYFSTSTEPVKTTTTTTRDAVVTKAAERKDISS